MVLRQAKEMVSSGVVKVCFRSVFWLRRRLRRRAASCEGQTMLEYIIVFCMFLGLMTVMGIFVYVLRQQSDRVLDLVASDFP